MLTIAWLVNRFPQESVLIHTSKVANTTYKVSIVKNNEVLISGTGHSEEDAVESVVEALCVYLLEING